MNRLSLYEQISSAVGICGVFLNFILFVVFFKQMRLLREQIKSSERATKSAENATERDILQRKRESTIEFYSETFQSRLMLVHELVDDRNSEAIRSLITTPESHTGELAHNIRAYLSMFEMLAAGVHKDVLDFDMVNTIAGARIVAIKENYWPWILERRERLNSQTIYIELENLAKRILEERGLNQKLVTDNG
jgi:hypothetical protein